MCLCLSWHCFTSNNPCSELRAFEKLKQLEFSKVNTLICPQLSIQSCFLSFSGTFFEFSVLANSFCFCMVREGEVSSYLFRASRGCLYTSYVFAGGQLSLLHKTSLQLWDTIQAGKAGYDSWRCVSSLLPFQQRAVFHEEFSIHADLFLTVNQSCIFSKLLSS